MTGMRQTRKGKFMTDKDVQREIEANERRAREREERDEEGGIAEAFEDLLDPFDGEHEENAEQERERRQNDADQRRGS